MRSFLFGTLLVSSIQAESRPFEIRGWDIERPDPQYVDDMIRQAKDAGMNTITLSHEVVMNAEEIILDWHRYKHLRHFCDTAHSYDMQVYLWNHQINNPPKEVIVTDPETGRRKLDMDDERLWEWLDDRYEQVVERVPNLDGIVISLTESDWQPHRDYMAVTTMTQAEKMARIYNTIHGALARHGKRLIVRDFFRTPREMESFRQAMEMVPDDVWVYTKCVANDWEYKYPPHPLLGRVAPHKQIMELDLHNETGPGRGIAMPCAYYYQEQLRLARERGLAGAVARCDDGFSTNEGTPNRFNIYAYSKLLHDPDADVDSMWEEWFVPFYGRDAAPVAIDVLKQSFELVCGVRYTLGFWTGDHMSTISYTDSHLVNHSSAHWSDDPKYRETEEFLLNSGPEAIAATVKEKKDAEEVALRCIEDLDAAKDRFDPEKFAQLRGYLENAVMHARHSQRWARAYFALRWYRNTKSPEAKQEVEAAIQACREFTEKLEQNGEDMLRMPEFIEEVEAAVGKVETGGQ